MTDKNEHINNETLSLYFDIKKKKNILTEPEQKEISYLVDEHIKSCPKCAAHLYMVESLYENEVKKYTHRSKIRRNISYSTSAVVILAILILFQPWKTEEIKIAEVPINDMIDSSVTGNSFIEDLIEEYISKKETDKELRLLAFSKEKEFELPSNYYEDELQELQVKESITRSSNDKIKNILPYNSAILNSPILFEWENFDGKVSIVIKDNKNQKIWEDSISNKRTLVCEINLEPGTYYWDFRINEKIQTKRKFYLIN